MTTTRIPKTSLWGKLPQWAWKLGLRANVSFVANANSRDHWTQETAGQAPQDCTDINAAQIITSAVEYPERTGMHKPILDIDFPAQLIPSSTPGHFHLYLDKELPWEKYQRLLKALSEAGIIEEGYYGASVARGYTALRLPWVRKEETPDQPRDPAAEAPSRPAAPAQAAPLGDSLAALAAMQASDPVLENIARAEARDTYSFPTVRPRRPARVQGVTATGTIIDEIADLSAVHRSNAEATVDALMSDAEERSRNRRRMMDNMRFETPLATAAADRAGIAARYAAEAVAATSASMASASAAATRAAEAVRHTWNHPEADPMGDIIAARDRIMESRYPTPAWGYDAPTNNANLVVEWSAPSEAPSVVEAGLQP